MKKLIYLLLMLTLVFSCSKPSTPEENRLDIVIEHLKDHYKNPEYKFEITDSLGNVGGFTKDDKYYLAERNNNEYYYYNEKGDKVKGYVYMITENIIDEKENCILREGTIKIIILSEDNEIVWCGTDYPQNGCKGECINKFTNLSKCKFEQ